MAEARYLPEFIRALDRHPSIRKNAKKKIENLLENPLGFGEPLKYDLKGLNSCPVKRNFIIVYVYCRECRITNHYALNACKDCNETPDEVVKFLTIGPHDLAYRSARKVEL